jgi:hypothetical protein
MKDLTCFDQLLHRACHVFDRHGRIDTVLVEEIDPVGAQAPQSFVRDLPNAFGTAVETVRRHTILEPEFRGDDDLVANRFERLANDLFVDSRTVCLGRIEEGDAAILRRADQRDRVLTIRCRTIAVA